MVSCISFLFTDVSAEQSMDRAGLKLTSRSHGFKLLSTKISKPKSSEQLVATGTEGAMGSTGRISTWLIFCHRSGSSTSQLRRKEENLLRSTCSRGRPLP